MLYRLSANMNTHLVTSSQKTSRHLPFFLSFHRYLLRFFSFKILVAVVSAQFSLEYFTKSVCTSSPVLECFIHNCNVVSINRRSSISIHRVKYGFLMKVFELCESIQRGGKCCQQTDADFRSHWRWQQRYYSHICTYEVEYIYFFRCCSSEFRVTDRW